MYGSRLNQDNLPFSKSLSLPVSGIDKKSKKSDGSASLDRELETKMSPINN